MRNPGSFMLRFACFVTVSMRAESMFSVLYESSLQIAQIEIAN